MSQPLFQVGVVGYEESRDLEKETAPDGTILNMKPVAGSERAFLVLELPGGTQIKAQVSHEVYTKHVLPAFEAASRQHRPGQVFSLDGFVPVRKDQVWEVCEAVGPGVLSEEIGDFDLVLTGQTTRLTVVGCGEGEVFLRAEDPEALRRMLSKEETLKGKTVETLPFKPYAADAFKSPKDKQPDETWKNGTFSAHEAWSVWRQMRLVP